jgi:hypothetical protein
LQLDRAKSGGGRCGEPLDQRPLGEQIGQIGGEAGHAQIHRPSLPGLTPQVGFSRLVAGEYFRNSGQARVAVQPIHLLNFCEEDGCPGQARA